MSFSASALSVPLVAWISLTYGELGPLFTVLAALAAITFAAALAFPVETRTAPAARSEEHTSELQSQR